LEGFTATYSSNFHDDGDDDDDNNDNNINNQFPVVNMRTQQA